MKDYQNVTNVNISTLTILKVVLVFVALYFLFLVRDVIAVLFVSLILASALNPWIDWLQTKKIPRVVGMILIYTFLFLAIGLILYLIVPPIIEQVGELSENFPVYFEKIISGFSVIREYSIQYGILDNVKESVRAAIANLQGAASGVFSTVSGIFGGVISFFLVLVITFYMVVEENAVKKIVWSIAPDQHQPYLMQLINRMQNKIGLWLRGQLILSIIIFTLTFIGLSILGVKYALTLALIAGLTEFVPYLGPVLAAIPAVFLAFTQSPMLGFLVIILYLVIQFVENNIIVPKLMQKVVGLNPIISIVVLLIGFNLGGIVGAILAIPVTTALSVFVKDVFEKRAQEKEIEERV